MPPDSAGLPNLQQSVASENSVLSDKTVVARRALRWYHQERDELAIVLMIQSE